MTPAAGHFSRHLRLYALSNALPAALGFASIVLLVRLFGAEAYGRYTVSLGIAVTAAAYAAGWLVQSILRFQSGWSAPDRLPVFVATVRRALAGAIAAGAVVVAIPLVQAGDLGAAGIIGGVALFATSSLYQVEYAHLQAALQPQRLLLAESLRAVLLVALPLGVYAAGSRSPAMLLLAALGAHAAGLVAVHRMARPERAAAARADDALLREVWRFGWPMGLWLGFAQLMVYADRLVIAWAIDYHAAGTYAAVFDITRKSFTLVLGPFTLAVHPLAAQLWGGGSRPEAQRLLRRALRAQMGLAAVGVVAVTLLEDVLLRLMLDVPALGEGLLLPLSLGSALWAIAPITQKPLELEGRTRAMLGCLAVAVSAAITADLLFVGRFGLVFVAWATAGSALLYIGLLQLVGRSHVSRLPVAEGVA